MYTVEIRLKKGRKVILKKTVAEYEDLAKAQIFYSYATQRLS